MDGNLNGQMLTFNQRYDNKNFNGNNNVIQILSKISNFVLNGSKNKIFLTSKISNIIINGNQNQINVFTHVIKAENSASCLGNIILNGNGNKITLNRRNYNSINKINNGSSNSVICADGSRPDSECSNEEETNTPNIRINIGNIQNFGNINFTTNVNGFVNRVLSHAQFASNESISSDEPEEEFSEESYDSQEANYDEVMNEQEKIEIKEKIINNFDKYKYYKYQLMKNKVKQESCAICLSMYKPNDNVVEFSCQNHIYHDSCLFEWLQSSDLCPLCKHNLMDEFNNYN